jgi:hypothetical protein
MQVFLARVAVALVLAVGLTAAAAVPKGAAPGRQPLVLAPDAQVDLNLVLAVDASGSVDDERFELQKEGYADAFNSQRVLDTIKAGDRQQIAVTMVQWTGPTLQVIMVPWMIIRDKPSAELFAEAVAISRRQIFGGGTSISGVIDYSVKLLNGAPYKGTRQVIDISGDGSNNLGRSVEQARDEAVAAGIRINGLPILLLEHDLDQYYRASVVGGPGAFVIPAKNYEVFGEAIMRKLVTEISQDRVAPVRAGEVAAKRPKLALK